MFGKNLFRPFLFLVLGLVLLKLAYNLGYAYANKKFGAANGATEKQARGAGQGQKLRGVIAEPADSAADAAPAPPAR